MGEGLDILSIHDAGLKMKHISEPVRKIFQHFSMPTGLYETIYNPNNEYRFGHMSGGVDKDAKAFISIYGGLEKKQL